MISRGRTRKSPKGIRKKKPNIRKKRIDNSLLLKGEIYKFKATNRISLSRQIAKKMNWDFKKTGFADAGYGTPFKYKQTKIKKILDPYLDVLKESGMTNDDFCFGGLCCSGQFSSGQAEIWDITCSKDVSPMVIE
jgi:hypothetical protein